MLRHFCDIKMVSCSHVCVQTGPFDAVEVLAMEAAMPVVGRVMCCEQNDGKDSNSCLSDMGRVYSV